MCKTPPGDGKTLLEWQHEASPDGILVVSPDREWISVNQRFLDMWGLDSVTAGAAAAWEKVVVDQVVGAHRFLAEIEELYAFSEKCIRDEVFLTDNRCFERCSVPLIGLDGRHHGRMWNYRDITDRNRTQQRLREILAQLAQVNRLISMSEMASALAHEVNQPLGALANYAGTCVELIGKNRLAASDLKTSFERINEQCLRVGRIIERMKGAVSKAVPKKRQISVNALIQEVRQLMWPDLQMWHLDLHLDLDPGVPFTMGDPIQIQQVLVNLIRNAMAATHAAADRTPVVVRTAAENSETQIRVIDHGTGIPERQLAQIFEPYVSSNPDELGMGLTICRTIINAHGGQIWAKNNTDDGATFFVTLPIEQPTGPPGFDEERIP